MKNQPFIIVKRVIPALLVCALLCSVFVVPASAKSGDKTVSSPTPAEIIERYQSLTPVTSIYDVKPSFTAPYTAGKVSDSMLQNALDYLNYCRFLVGLPEVSMSDAMNNEAQHGAVLLAASDQFTHYPQKPADMSQSFYDAGYRATTSANLAGLYAGDSEGFWDSGDDALLKGIQGCMEDDTSYVNLTEVGHRRWFLNPSLKYVGFGYGATIDTRVSVIKCHDQSGRDVDYDYVAWPPAGYCPSNEFQVMVPWSVSLNPDVYSWVDPNAVKVTVRNETTGETVTVTNNNPCDRIGEPYLSVAGRMYGEGDCIVFSLGYYVQDDGGIPFAYRTGTYTVTISGLTYLNGSPATVKYTTEFFDLEKSLKLSIDKQPTDASAAIGDIVKTTVTASGAGLRYQWYVKEPGTKKWVKSSVKTATYSYEMTKAKSGRQVYCVITDAFGKSVTSDTVTLKIKTPYITKQPSNVIVNVGSTAKTSVKAEGEGLTYQWYVKNPGSSSFIKSSNKTDTYKYVMTPEKSGRQAYCVITDKYGDKTKSNTVTLRMPRPKFTKQPTNVTVKAGELASITVEGSGSGLTYQWYFKNRGVSTFSKSSVTGPVYDYIMTPEKSGRQVYCVITDQYGQTAKSDTATLSMPKPKFTKQPVSAKAVAGKTVKTSVKATGEGLTYQWYYKNPGASKFLKSSVTSPTYSMTMTAAKAGRQVYCVITDQYGQTVKSDTVTFSIPKLKITKQPTSAKAAIGSTVKTAVTASGDGLTYRWYFKNADMKTFSKSSVTSATYSYTMTAAKAGRQVYCVITDQYGQTVKTNTVTLNRT